MRICLYSADDYRSWFSLTSEEYDEFRSRLVFERRIMKHDF